MARERRRPQDPGESAALRQALSAEQQAHARIERARQQAATRLDAEHARVRARMNALPERVARLHVWTERGIARQLECLQAEEAAASRCLDEQIRDVAEYFERVERFARELTGGVLPP